MKKAELIIDIVEKTGFPRKKVDFLIDTMLDTIKENLEAGEKVTIQNFGFFEVRRKKERIGVSPVDGKERIHVDACNSVFFKASRVLKGKM